MNMEGEPELMFEFRFLLGIELVEEHKIVGILGIFDIEDCRMGMLDIACIPVTGIRESQQRP